MARDFSSAASRTKFNLEEEDMPRAWYNIQADLPTPAPAGAAPRHGPTHRPRRPGAPLPDGDHQAGGQPGALHRHPRRGAGDVYRLWRPTPLYRAHRLEKALDTPARIFYKYEGVSPVGSHKPNTAVAQAYYNKAEGVKAARHRDGRGAVGQRAGHGDADVRAGMHGLHGQGVVLPEAVSPLAHGAVRGAGHPQPQQRDQRRARHPGAGPRSRPAAWASPSPRRSRTPPRATTPSIRSGSVLNHVLMHQTVIGQEAQQQMEMADAYPDVVIGCVGGGSNFAGLTLPFIGRQAHAAKRPNTRIVAVEPAACPSLTKGVYAYDFGDTVGMAPMVKMHTLGHSFVPQADPRGRPALPRRGAADQPPATRRAASRRWPTRRTRSSRRPYSSPAARASCPRPSRPTPSARR